ncbi:type II toxin-antitoxin system VapC family toxin [Paenibacillus lactis]|uniref:type II toxin-antitoxin system VapC family toxin n=1 Tax=Paenibacillus lactis TaxID=228574 RepID=UPI0011A14F9A
MEKVDFNHHSFQGFEIGEDILVDTCILTALTNEYDPWHNTILHLFNKHIFPDDKIVLLYTNPLIVNEVLHLSTKALRNFSLYHQVEFDDQQIEDSRIFIERMMTIFIEEGILQVLEADKDSIIQQIRLSNTLGAADATNVSIANLYGVNFMTIDNRLVHNMFSVSSELSNIQKVYYTTPDHKTY